MALLEIPKKKTSGFTKLQGFLANDTQEVDALNNFMHAKVPVIQNNPIKAGIKRSMYLHQTKNYIVLLQEFERQTQIFPNYQDRKEEFSSVVSSLFDLSPNNLSFSLTNDDSVFFIFKKGGFEIHFNYYLECDETDLEEEQVIFTLYEQGVKKPSFSGTLPEAIEQLENILENGHVSRRNLTDSFQLFA